MDCIFCKIVEGAIPASKIYENDDVLVFRDIQPAAPVHALIIPKRHIPSLNDAEGDDFALLGKVMAAAQHAAKTLGVADSGYRLINNCGADGGQVVYHIHFHLLGGEKLGPLHMKE